MHHKEALAGFNFNLMLQPGQGSVADPKPTNSVKIENGVADAISTSLTYANDDLGLTAGIAYDKNVLSKLAAAGVPTAVVGTAAAGPTGATAYVYNGSTAGDTAGYNIKPVGLSFNAEYQTAERSHAYNYTYAIPGAVPAVTYATPSPIKPKETGYLLNAAWKFAEGWTGKLQYVTSTTKFGSSGAQDIDLSEITLGADYNFTSTTKVYGFYSELETKNKNNLSTNPAKTGIDDNVKRTFASLGIEHKF